MASSEIEAVIDARKQATKAISTERTRLSRKKNRIIEKAAEEHRPPTADEKAAIAECKAVIAELNNVEETLIIVTNLELSSSAEVKALAKQVAAVNEGLVKEKNKIVKIIDMVNSVAETIKKINDVVTQLGKLAAVL